MKGTHFLIFIHGVNTRQRRTDPGYSCELAGRIIAHCGSDLHGRIKPIEIYWGDINEPYEKSLLDTLEASSVWRDLFLKDIRKKQMIQFVGDAALYLSREIGSAAVCAISQQAANGLAEVDPKADNLIHLVTHSWGTVILFDILFSKRWYPSDLTRNGNSITFAANLRSWFE